MGNFSFLKNQISYESIITITWFIRKEWIMSIFSKLFHTRDKPQNYYTGTDMHYLFGRSSSDKRVNEFTAMQTTAVYACVRILAETLAALPLHLYRYTPGGKERVYDHPLYHLLHDEPNPEMTSFIFRETLIRETQKSPETARFLG